MFLRHDACVKCGRSLVLSLGGVKPKTTPLVFVASPLSMQQQVVRTKTGLPRIRTRTE